MKKQIINLKTNKFNHNKKEIESFITKEKEKKLFKTNKNDIELIFRKNLEKSNKFKSKIKNNFNFPPIFKANLSLLIIFMILFLPFSFSEYYSNFNQITLIVKGKNFHKIMSPSVTKPYSITINNNRQKISDDMNYYFNDEINTVVLKWNSFLTSCKDMFKDINCLISIDLSYFNTKMVTDMFRMFYNCSNLQSINFKNIDTSNVQNMGYIFFNIPLKSLDLSNFNTSKVVKMPYMFYDCSNLETLDLSKFITNFVDDMDNMFNGASSLISLDLSNFNTSLVKKMNHMFYRTKSLMYINLISFEEREGVELVNIFSSNIDKLVYCINKEKAPQINEMLKYQNLENDCEIFKKLNTSKVKFSHKIEKSEYIENMVNTERNENDENIYKSQLIEEKEYFPTNKINNNFDKTQYIENAETTEIIYKFSLENLFNKSNEINIENVKIKDEIIKKIKNEIINGSLDSLINITKENEDLLYKTSDTLYQITTSQNQKNNSYKNISTLNLRDCEDRLKGIYNIDKSLPLIIFKVDYYKKNSLIPVISYEIYHPVNKSQLDLNYCKDILISLDIPVSIDEDKYFKYDPNSEYYTDECYTYTTENGTDIILNDRQNEYDENNFSICENNCTLIGYDKITKKASCECESKSKISLISDIIEDKNILSNYFNDEANYASSIVTMKCVYTLFSKEGLLTNIGNYILLISIIIFGISSILYYKCGYHIIETEIKEIIELKKKGNNTNEKFNLMEVKQRKKKFIKKKKKSKNISSINNPIKKINLTKNSKKDKENNTTIYSKSEIKNINAVMSSNKKIINSSNINIYKEQKQQERNENLKYKNHVLNAFNYKEALKYDKRSFAQYYFNLLKIKNLILFSFYPIEDYNIKIIKICLFFLFFDIYLAINTLFFNESTIHQIYKDNGAYNIGYLLPQIIFSFFISYFISNVIKFFTLSERNLHNLINTKNNCDLNDKASEERRCIIIKNILFFIISFIFLFLFWYYLASFCAVYKNSQIYLFNNAFISFILALLIPFIFNLFLSFMRIYSLQHKGNESLFKISKIIEIFL